jgi:hypothetical protein
MPIGGGSEWVELLSPPRAIAYLKSGLTVIYQYRAGLDSARLICATLLTLLIGLTLDANVQLLDGARPELNDATGGNWSGAN